MKSNIFIPKTINVGYQKRSDTYTGKLAYVIYYDEKGKLRKEASWNSWRDKNIPNEEFENIPTSGFVLNKKVGDYSSGWEHRQAYCRVYDPRNFEFEITIENLLYILENANSIKGKGLEGRFIYGWDGKDLILMPVESPDYKQIEEYNQVIHNSEQIKAKNLIIGATYLTKDNKEYTYMGKFEYFSDGYTWYENGEYKISKKYIDIPNDVNWRKVKYETTYGLLYGKYFWFAYKIGNEWNFEQLKSIPKGKFIKCMNEKCSSEYADIFNVMEGSYHYSPYDKTKNKFLNISLEDFIKLSHRYEYYNHLDFISEYTGEKITYRAYSIDRNENSYILKINKQNSKYHYENDTSIFPTSAIEVEKSIYENYRSKVVKVKEEKMIPVTIEEIYEVMKPLYIQKYLANGREYEKEYTLYE